MERSQSNNHKAATSIKAATFRKIAAAGNKKATKNPTQDKRRKKLIKEQKATICVALIILNLVLTQSIFIATMPIYQSCDNCVNTILYSIGYWASYCFSALNPLILLTFHSDYNQEIKRLIKNLFCFFQE
jgi:hypothetical protein